MLLFAVTPCGSSSSPPQELQEGEAGFAVMFPSMDGVHVKPFHFCKNSLSPMALKEAGEVQLYKEQVFCLSHIVLCCWHYFFFVVFPLPGLVDNPDLRVVLLFVYSPYQPGGRRFLKQVLDPLGKSKALIAGGIVESAFSPPSQWWVPAFQRGQTVCVFKEEFQMNSCCICGFCLSLPPVVSYIVVVSLGSTE